jgi:hypothetical protein
MTAVFGAHLTDMRILTATEGWNPRNTTRHAAATFTVMVVCSTATNILEPDTEINGHLYCHAVNKARYAPFVVLFPFSVYCFFVVMTNRLPEKL